MAGDSITIEEIKALVNDYNVILAKYVAANKSLSSLGSYEMLSTKKITGGHTSYSGTIPTVEACQAKCGNLKCATASYNSNTKGCLINNDGQMVAGSAYDSVIINKQVYYLNQLDNLNTQLTDVNNKIMTKIGTINSSGYLTNLYKEMAQRKEQLRMDQLALDTQINNITDNSSVLDLEYVKQDTHLDTNSHYYIFILLAMICLIVIIILIAMQI